MIDVHTLIKAARDPLALFLEDALKHIHHDFMSAIVRPYIETSSGFTSDGAKKYREYTGQERVANSRNEERSRLHEFDVQFLTQLLEFSIKVPRPGNCDTTLLYPNLSTFLPIDTRITPDRVKLIRYIRNKHSHESNLAEDEHTVMSDVGKLLDLFRGELQHCIEKRPEYFSADTKKSIDQFVDVLKIAHKKPLGAQEPSDAYDSAGVSRDLQSSTPKFASDSSNTNGHATTKVPQRKNRKLVGMMLFVIAIVIAVTGILLYRYNAPDIQPAVHRGHDLFIISAEPLTSSSISRCRDILFRKLSLFAADRITILADGKQQELELSIHNGKRKVLDSALTILSAISPMSDAMVYSDLIKTIYPTMQKSLKSGRKPQLIVIGSVGNFTDAQWAANDASALKVYPSGIGEWWKENGVNEMTFLSIGSSTFTDSMLVQGIKDSDVPVVRITIE